MTQYPGAATVRGDVVEFALFAPGKRRVSLVGDFNEWNAASDPLSMHEGVWRVEKRLGAGRHAYGFGVDGRFIPDPYAREAEWQAGSPKTFVLVGTAPFQWRHDAFKRPAYPDLTIYEILVGDFSPEGTFEGVTARLDHVQQLGVNCIELMPLTCGPPRDHWGYHPVFYFAPEAGYGTPDDLRRLVDEAHGRGMAVIVDVCLAHSGKQHPFLQLYPYSESPWYGEPFGGQNEFGLPSFDYRKPATQAFTREVLQFWLREFHLDGYRLDYARLIGEHEGMGVPQLARDIRAVRPDAYIITEVLPEIPQYINQWDVNGSWHESLQNTLTDNLTLDLLPEAEREPEQTWQHLLRALNPVEEDYCNADLCVNFVGTHDEERMMRVLTDRGLPEEEALARVELATALVFCMAGSPMMFHGEEWGERTEKKLTPNPLHWERLETPSGQRLFQFFQWTIGLRKSVPALRSPGVEVTGTDADQRCLQMRRWSGEAEQPSSEVVIAANFSTYERTMPLSLRAGTWREARSGQKRDVENGLKVMLGPFQFQLWFRKD